MLKWITSELVVFGEFYVRSDSIYRSRTSEVKNFLHLFFYLEKVIAAEAHPQEKGRSKKSMGLQWFIFPVEI